MIVIDIIISNFERAPIYEQICSQVKSQIVSGKLKEGDPLPSIRKLAKELRISVITTKRAYDELEREGYVYTVAGKGCFVAKRNIQLIREDNLRKIEEHLRSIAELAASCNLGDREIFEMYRIFSKE